MLSTYLLRADKALLCENSLKLGGVGTYGSKDRRIFPIWVKIYNIIARILRQSKLNEYMIIDTKVGDDHRSLAENQMVHAIPGQWPFGQSKLDLKQSSLKRVRSNNLKLASWRAELVQVDP